MSDACLKLIVLRVADLERAAAFYGAIGLKLVKHAHGSGPQHYACEDAGVVFELYPATVEQPVSASARTGFAVSDVDAVIDRASRCDGVRVVSAPKASEWGRRAVLTDPDGHRVELTQASGGD